MNDEDIDLATDGSARSQCDDEVIALIKAWQDRGIPVVDSAIFMSARANMMLAMSSFSLVDIIKVIREQWMAMGGNP